MTSSATARILIRIDSDDPRNEEGRDAMARQLLREIRDELPAVSSAELSTGGAAPQGTKGAEVATIGAVTVAILPNLLPQLIEFIKSWTLRGHGRTVKIHLESENRKVDVEYDPATATSQELAEFVRRINSPARAEP